MAFSVSPRPLGREWGTPSQRLPQSAAPQSVATAPSTQSQCLTVAQAQECSIRTCNYRGWVTAPALARAQWQEIRRWHQEGLCVCAKLRALSTPSGPAHKASIVGVWLPAHLQPDRSCCSDKARKVYPKFVQMPLPHPYQVEGRELASKANVDSEKKEKEY